MFATGQSVRPRPGRGRTTLCRPVQSFSELARRVRPKDQDGRHCVVPHRPPSSPNVICRPPPSPVVFGCFPMLSAVFRRPRRPYVVTIPAVPWEKLSQAVGLVVLANDGRPGNSRTRMDYIFSSRPVIFQSCPTCRNERRGRTTFCRPVSSRALGIPPAGPHGGPGRLRTLYARMARGPPAFGGGEGAMAPGPYERLGAAYSGGWSSAIAPWCPPSIARSSGVLPFSSNLLELTSRRSNTSTTPSRPR